MQSTITTGANQFVQRAAIEALEGPRQAVEAMRLRYKARRDMVLAGLRAIAGVRIAPIPATFYAFPDVSALLGRKSGNHVLDTAERLCDWLLEEHGVATVPGSAFGARGSIRLSFAASEQDIEKALARLARRSIHSADHSAASGNCWRRGLRREGTASFVATTESAGTGASATAGRRRSRAT